jgi:hypothetical protein
MMTLMFFTSDTLISRVIKFFTKGTVTHVAIGGFEIAGIKLCLHSDIKGVRFATRDSLTSNMTLVSEWNILADDVEEQLPTIIKKIGSSYDFGGVFGIGIVQILKWINIKAKNPFHDTNSYFCSELVLGLSKKVPEWNGLDPVETTPEDLLDICKRSSSFLKVL